MRTTQSSLMSTLRPRQNGRHFADDMFKCIFLNENVWIPIEISLTFVPKGSINNNPALFQIMALRRLGDKPLSEPMMVRLPTHICVTRPHWVKKLSLIYSIHTIHSFSFVSPVDQRNFNYQNLSQLLCSSLYQGPFYSHGLTLIPAWISNHMPSKAWDKITKVYVVEYM